MNRVLSRMPMQPKPLLMRVSKRRKAMLEASQGLNSRRTRISFWSSAVRAVWESEQKVWWPKTSAPHSLMHTTPMNGPARYQTSLTRCPEPTSISRSSRRRQSDHSNWTTCTTRWILFEHSSLCRLNSKVLQSTYTLSNMVKIIWNKYQPRNRPQ